MKTNKGAVIGLTAVLGVVGLGWAATSSGPYLGAGTPDVRVVKQAIHGEWHPDRSLKEAVELVREHEAIPDKDEIRAHIKKEMEYHGRAGIEYTAEIEPMIEEMVESGLELAFGSVFADSKEEFELKKADAISDLQNLRYQIAQEIEHAKQEEFKIYVDGTKVNITAEQYNQELKPFFKELNAGLTGLFEECIADVPYKKGMSWISFGEAMSEWGDACGAKGEAFGLRMEKEGDALEERIKLYEAQK